MIQHGDLVARIRAGDSRAEASLVEHYRRAVGMVLRHHFRGGDGAEDLFQETFRLALEKIRLGEPRDPEKLASFLMGLARNLALGHFRQKARRRTDQDSETVARLARTQPSQLGTLLHEEKLAHVRRLIGKLSTERDRQVLFRFYLGDEAKEAICSDLGLSSLHFNRVLHRARQRLKQIYEQTQSIA